MHGIGEEGAKADNAPSKPFLVRPLSISVAARRLLELKAYRHCARQPNAPVSTQGLPMQNGELEAVFTLLQCTALMKTLTYALHTIAVNLLLADSLRVHRTWLVNLPNCPLVRSFQAISGPGVGCSEFHFCFHVALKSR